MIRTYTIAEAFLLAKKSLDESVFSDKTKIVRMLFEDLFDIKNIERRDQLSLHDWQMIEKALVRLNGGEPLQYVTQVAHFYGLEFYVDPRVLIPRSETEELVYYVLEILTDDARKNLRLLDIGTGSGCIALTLQYKYPSLDITAIDISAEALEVAEINRAKYDFTVSLVLDDIRQAQNLAIKAGKWDYIVSNPPYIHRDEKHHMDRKVLDYEPIPALFPENGDVLGMYTTILEYCDIHLNKEGWFFLELNEFLSEEIKLIAVDLGFVDTAIIIDMQGKARILKGRKRSDK
jgi:release factor glutamine methyltransferase